MFLNITQISSLMLRTLQGSWGLKESLLTSLPLAAILSFSLFPSSLRNFVLTIPFAWNIRLPSYRQRSLPHISQVPAGISP